MKGSKTKNIIVEYAGLTDAGKVRTENQDSYGQFPENTFDSLAPGGLMFIVADGMGGHVKGEEASRMAVQILSKAYYQDRESDVSRALVRSVQEANTAIFEQAKNTGDAKQMGTTVSVLVLKGTSATVAHVGDSRIYLIRDSRLIQLTTDHTKVEELKRAGIINKEEAKKHPEKSVLQRALGVKENVRVDISSDLQVKAGDIFILCSDGLALVKQEEILDIAQNERPPVACQKLIDLANERGGIDNSTVLTVKIEKPDSGTELVKHELRSVAIWLSILIILLISATVYISFQYGKTDLRAETYSRSDQIEDEGTLSDLFTKARQYVTRNQYEDAINIYQQILTLNPLETDALKELDQIASRLIIEGERYKIQGNMEKALDAFRQAAEIRPKDKTLADLIRTIEDM